MRRITNLILQEKCAHLCTLTGRPYKVSWRNGYCALDLMRGSAVRHVLSIGTNREIAAIIDAIYDHVYFARYDNAE